MDHSEYIRHIPGSKYALLLIHGICGSPAHFRHFLSLVPDSWSVYNLLLDGHGGSVRDFSRSSMAKWQTQVSNRLAQIRVAHETVLIVGHSMGTLFAIEEAVNNPRQIGSLFLLNVPLYAKWPPSSMFLSTGCALGLTQFPAVKAMVDDCSIALTPWLWQYLGWIPRFAELLKKIQQVRTCLPRLTVPARSFHSQKDELVRTRSSNLLENHPCVSHAVLPHSGHFAYAEEDLQLLKAQFEDWISKNKTAL